MKVLMSTSVLPRWPGDATPPFVLNLAEDLVGLGCTITVLAPHSAGAARREPHRGVTIVRYPYLWPQRLQTLCYGGGMLVRLQGHRGRALQLPAFALAQAWATRRAIQRQRPDLLHSHSLLPQGLIAEAVRPQWLPHLTTSHGNDVFGLKASGPMGAGKRWVLRRVAAVTANSRATRDALLSLGCAPEKIHWIPASPNEAPADPHHAATLRESWGPGPRLLFVGRLIPEKGPQEAIAALKELHTSHPTAQLWILGDGPLRPQLEQQVAASGLQGHVRFKGWVPAEELAAYRSAAQLLVAPSRHLPGGWREAQGLTIAEALLQGLPVVATAVGGIPDMVQSGVNGVLVAPNDLQALVEGLRACLQQTFPTRGMTDFRNRYSREAVARTTLNLYEALAANAPLVPAVTPG